jgi:hypothetical protein
MRRPVVLICGVMFLFAACLSFQYSSYVENDPAFSRTQWQGKKVCIFPALLHDKAHINAQFLEEKVLKDVKDIRIGDAVPALQVKRMITEKKLIEKYEMLVRHMQSFHEVNDTLVAEIAGELGFDYAIMVSSVNDGIVDTKDEAGYSASTDMFIIRTSDKKVLRKYSDSGSSTRTKAPAKPKKKTTMGDVVDDILSDDSPDYTLAYERAIYSNCQKFAKKFVGECTSGNCVDGSGVFTYYNGNGNLSEDRYEGSWQNGLAHGTGTAYKRKLSKILTKYDGVWEKGKLKKMGQEFSFINGKWIVVQNENAQ